MKTIARIKTIDLQRLDRRTIARAAEIIHRGAVVVFPTSGLYGLAADAFNARAVTRIFDLKGRNPSKPLLVLVDSPEMVSRVAQSPSALARHLMTCFWPGKVTLVMPALPDLPPGLTAPDGTIGVRQVAHPVAAALVRAFGGPITGTSANLSGAGGCAAVSGLDPAICAAVDLVIDAGPLLGHPGSTVVEVKEQRVTILREGVVPRAQIMAAVEQFAAAAY